MPKRPISVRQGIPALLLFTFVVPLAVVWLITLVVGHRVLAYTEHRSAESEAQYLAQSFDLYLLQHHRSLQIMADAWGPAKLSERRALMQRLNQIVVSLHRVIWLSQGKTAMSEPHAPQAPPLTPLQPVMAGASPVSQPYLSPFGQRPVFAIAMPAGGGWLVVEYDLEIVAKRFLPSHALARIVDQRGRVLLALNHRPFEVAPPPERGDVLGEAGIEPWGATLQVIVPASKWRPMIRLLNAGMLVLLIVSSGYGVWLALAVRFGVDGPLAAINAKARDLAAGDWQARVQPQGLAELQDLAENFNRTAEALQGQFLKVHTSNQRLFKLSEMASTLRGSLDLEVTLPIACRQIAHMFDAALAWIGTWSPEDQALTRMASHPTNAGSARVTVVAGSALWEAIHRQKPVVIENVTSPPFPYTPMLQDARAAFLLPLVAEDRTIGLLWLCSTKGPRFVPDGDRHLLEIAAKHLSSAIDQARLLRLKQLAEARFQAILQSARDVVITTDLEGRITSISPSIERITGFAATELEGQSFGEFLHPADVPLAHAMFAQALMGQIPPLSLLRARTRTGGFATLEITSLGRREREGVAEILGLARDVSQRVALERDLRHRTHDLEILVGASRALGASLDPQVVQKKLWRSLRLAIGEGIYLVLFPNQENQLVATACNRPASHLGRASLDQIVFPLDSPVGAAFQKGESQILPASRLGQVIEGVATIWIQPVRYRGQVVGVLMVGRSGEAPFQAHQIALAEGVLNQAAIALENARLFANLQAAQQQSEAVLSALAEGLLLIVRPDRIARANQSAQRILGLPAHDLIGRRCSDVLGDILADEQAQDRLIPYVRPDGHPISLRINWVPYDHTGAVITFRDVTHEEAVSRMKSEFVSLASHELRTPMTIIRGYVETLLLADEIGLDRDKRQSILSSVRAQTDRLSRIVDDLLSVSRIEAQRIPFHPRPLALEPLIARVRRDLAVRGSSKGIAVRLELPGDPLPQVWADADHVTQILQNLLDNAIKYSPPDRLITITLAHTGNYVRVAVKDQGIGIPPERISHVFQKFQRIPSPLSYRERGTGLGLYITRRLTELQGGTVLAASEPDVGSTFAFTLPVYRPVAKTQAA